MSDLPLDGPALSGVRSAIVELLKSGRTPDEVTDALDAELTDEQWAACRRYFLSRYVQDVSRGFRSTKPPQIMRAEVAPTSEQPSTPAQPVRSAKVAAIRSWWAERLNGYWPEVGKRLGDMDVDDLLQVAAANHAEAEKNRAVAARFERLADELRSAGTGTVSGLDESAGRRAWDGAAA